MTDKFSPYKMVKSIQMSVKPTKIRVAYQMSVKPKIDDYLKGEIPILWSTRMDHEISTTRYLGMR